MKKIAFAVATMAMALTAQASHWGEYDKNALELASKLLLCSKEVAEIGKNPYTRAVAAGYVGGMTPEGGVGTTYTVRYVQTYPAPSFASTEFVLTISEKSVPSNNTAPDAPGMITRIKCSVEKKNIE